MELYHPNYFQELVKAYECLYQSVLLPFRKLHTVCYILFFVFEMFGQDVDFLAVRHRHNFGVEMEIIVNHNDPSGKLDHRK